MGLQQVEQQIRDHIDQKEFHAAHAMIDEFERVGGSRARGLMYQAEMQSEAADGRVAEAVQLLLEAAQCRGESVETRTLVYLALSRLATEANNRQAMRRLRVLVEQLWLDHSDHPAVQKSRGPLLMKFADHAIRNGDFAVALSLSGEAIPWLSRWEEHRALLVETLVIRTFGFCWFKRTAEARETVAEAGRLDADGSCAHLVAMGRARLACTRGEWQHASALIDETLAAAARLPVPNWTVVSMARFMRMEVFAAEHREGFGRLAEELRTLASEHKLSYLFRMIKNLTLHYHMFEKKPSDSK